MAEKPCLISDLRTAGVGFLLALLAPTATALAQDHRGEDHWCATCAGLMSGNGPLYQPVTRWSSTVVNGSGLVQGQHTTLTWSIIPDGTNMPGSIGESAGPSDLIAVFDGLYGAGPGGSDLTQRPWFGLFEESFDRWSQLAALDYIYVTDDGAAFPTTSGAAGLRGDVRIGGHLINGPGGVLAYNWYPNTGDMIFDTGDLGILGNSDPDGEYRRARNITMHEHGHGMGIAHTESSSHSFLMEPFLSAAFLGPQFDDILSANRLYGDVLEKNGGNDTVATAYDFGTLNQGNSVSIGFDAVDAVVAYTDTSFVSIDDESDVDTFSFTVNPETGVRIVVRPVGPVYRESEQTGDPNTQSNFYAYALSDLTLTLIDSDGTTVLRFADVRDLGGHEILFEAFDEAGTYYVQVAGLTTNWVQMYQLDLIAGPVPEPASAGLLLAAGFLVLRRRRAA